ncbi:hypothetical protein ABIF41_001617 [Bradyrhizobium japonicum]
MSPVADRKTLPCGVAPAAFTFTWLIDSAPMAEIAMSRSIELAVRLPP